MLSSWGSSSVRKSCCACTHPIPHGPAKSSLVPRKGRRALDQTLTLPAPLPCYIPTWTKAERSIQYNTYIFHYEIAISFPAFYFMHPELYAAFYITPEGWWGWVVSHARQLLSLEVTHRTHQQLIWQDLNMIPIPPFPLTQLPPSPATRADTALPAGALPAHLSGSSVQIHGPPSAALSSCGWSGSSS